MSRTRYAGAIRGQSETLGLVLLLGVVVVTAAAFGSAYVGTVTDRGDRVSADVSIDLDPGGFTVTHEGGAELPADELRLLLRGPGFDYEPGFAAEFTAGPDSEDDDGDGVFEPGERWANDTAAPYATGDDVRTTLVHGPTNTVLFDQDVSVVDESVPEPAPGVAAEPDPIADAGPDGSITDEDGREETAELDGSNSTPRDDDPSNLTYEWTIVDYDGADASNASIDDPTATVTDLRVLDLDPGTYDVIVELTVRDGEGGVGVDRTTVTVTSAAPTGPTNQPPVADAGPDRTVAGKPNVKATLDGTGSRDPDGSGIAYSWTIVDRDGLKTNQVGWENAKGDTIKDKTKPVFGVQSKVNDREHTVRIELTVTDADGATDTDTVTVTVDPPPTANPGKGKSAQPGKESGSSATSLSGPAPAMAGTAGAATTTVESEPAVAVAVQRDGSTRYRIEVDSLAALLTDPKSVGLDGSASSDPDDELSFSWSVKRDGIAGTVLDNLELADADTASPALRVGSFFLSSDVDVPIELTVTEVDDTPVSDSATVVVTLERNVDAPTITGVSVPSSAVVGESIDTSVTATDDVSITAHEWRFGDGTTATGSEVSHTYVSPGTYTVTVVVTNEAGISATRTRTVTVTNPAPTIGSASLIDAEDGNGVVTDGHEVRVEATVSDPADDVASVTADASAFGGSASLDLADSDGDGTYTATFDVSAGEAGSDGRYGLTVVATDENGKTGAGTSGTLELDTTAPTVSNLRASVTDGTLTATFDANEELSSVTASVETPAGTREWTFSGSPSGSGYEYTATTSASEAGEYTVRVSGVADVAGNGASPGLEASATVGCSTTAECIEYVDGSEGTTDDGSGLSFDVENAAPSREATVDGIRATSRIDGAGKLYVPALFSLEREVQIVPQSGTPGYLNAMTPVDADGSDITGASGIIGGQPAVIGAENDATVTMRQFGEGTSFWNWDAYEFDSLGQVETDAEANLVVELTFPDGSTASFYFRETNGGSTPGGAADPGHAYLDKNDNGVFDGSDERVERSELADGEYSTDDHALVVPESVGGITTSNGIDFTAKRGVRIGTSLGSRKDVTLSSSEGNIVVDGTTIDTYQGGSGNGKITLDAGGNVDASGSTLQSKKGIEFDGTDVRLDGSTVDTYVGGSGNGKIEFSVAGTISAKGGSLKTKKDLAVDAERIDLTDATVDTYVGGSGNGKIDLSASSAVDLTRTELRSKKDVTVDGEALTLTDATVDAYQGGSGNGEITLDAGDDVLSGTDVVLKSKKDIDVTAGTTSLDGAVVDNYQGGSGNGEVSIDVSGELTAIGAVVDSKKDVSLIAESIDLRGATVGNYQGGSGNGEVELVTESGNLALDGASLSTKRDLIADVTGGILSVDGARFLSRGSGGKLTNSNDASVVGTPATGSVD
jgi:hypothetical protein